MIVRFEEYDHTPLETVVCEPHSADERGAWFTVDESSALFVPWNADWCARFYDGDDDGLEVFAQMVRPVHLSDELIEFMLLDLGVEVSSGAVHLTGEEEFEWNRVAHEYSDELIARARRAANDVLERVMMAAYPFDRTAEDIVGGLRNERDTRGK